MTTIKTQLLSKIEIWAKELGFTNFGVTSPYISESVRQQYKNRIAKNNHGDMHYLSKNSNVQARFNPKQLLPDVKSVLMFSMNYWSQASSNCQNQDPEKANIALYALGRDYHKVIRSRLKKLASKIGTEKNDFNFCIFCDSAPVLEKYFASQAGLGFIGKNGLLINPSQGSFFVLGGMYTNLELPFSKPIAPRCGNCQRCLNACPTKALCSPQHLDAKRCLSYLTIEHQGEISAKFSRLLKNQIFGCDICQKVCPWNRFAKETQVKDFAPKPYWQNAKKEKLLKWSQKIWEEKTAGTPLRRLGFSRWRRNLKANVKNN